MRQAQCGPGTRLGGETVTAASAGRPDLVAVAMTRVHPLLRSSLPRVEWRRIEDEFDSALATLNDPQRSSEHALAVLSVVRLLSGSEVGRDILAGRLAAQDAVLARSP